MRWHRAVCFRDKLISWFHKNMPEGEGSRDAAAVAVYIEGSHGTGNEGDVEAWKADKTIEVVVPAWDRDSAVVTLEREHAAGGCFNALHFSSHCAENRCEIRVPKGPFLDSNSDEKILKRYGAVLCKGAIVFFHNCGSENKQFTESRKKLAKLFGG